MSPAAKKSGTKTRKGRTTTRTRKRKPEPPQSIGDYLRRQRKLADVSMRKVAEQTGIPTSLLRDIESGLRQPSRAILGSLAGALRLSADTLNLQAGVIDPEAADDSDVVREILRDPTLTERQAEILVDLYRTFRALSDAEL